MFQSIQSKWTHSQFPATKYAQKGVQADEAAQKSQEMLSEV